MSTSLSRRGWGVVMGSVVLMAFGRALGLLELYVLGAGCGALVVAAVAYVAARQPDLDASRRLDPPRVHAGDDSRVELAIRNRSRRRSPVLTLRDALAGGPRQARFLLLPLAPGESDEASYRLPADRRGVFTVGPLVVEWCDPFAIVRRWLPAAPATELTVYPRIDPVPPLPDSPGRDHHHTSPQAALAGPIGEDFYALREYRHGDDLRRVHWPSTARRDQLMIRQDEVPWLGRATIVLDVRAAVHSASSFEAAVSAAASVLVASWHQGSVVRVLTTDGVDSGFGSGPGHLQVILGRLALVNPCPDPSLDGLSLDRAVDGAMAVVTTTAAGESDLARLAALARKETTVTLVALAGGGPGPEPRWPPVGRVVVVDGPDTFSSAWHVGVGGPGTHGTVGTGT